MSFSPKAMPISILGIAAVVLSVSLILTRQGSLVGSIPAVHHHGGAVHMQADVTPGTNAQAQRPATIVKPVSCEKLPDVPGKAVTTAIVEFPPQAYSPAHRHPGSVTAFVLKGMVRSQLAGGPVGTYKPGGTWFEPPGALHLFAENASSTEPAELLAFFVADENCGPLVIPEP